MTIKLTASILIAGASQPTGTSLTLNAAAEAELVNRGVAVYTSRALAPGEGLVPAMMNAAGTALVDPVTGGDIQLGGADAATDSITIDRATTGGNTVSATTSIVEIVGTAIWTRTMSKNARGEILSVSAAVVS